MKRLRRSKAAREKFVESLIGNSIPAQIRTIRDRQGLSQEQLAELAGGMNQNAISRLESASYGKPTLTTLKRIASALDVGLMVRFVPFSQLADWASGTPHVDLGRGTDAFAVPSFTEEEKAEKEAKQQGGSLYLLPMAKGLQASCISLYNTQPVTQYNMQPVAQLATPKQLIEKPFRNEIEPFVVPNLFAASPSRDVCNVNQLS
jgi:transcriptional regulator with XRE-family HTH domain